MSLQDELQKVVDGLKKIITVKPETQAEIEAVKKLKESGGVNKGI